MSALVAVVLGGCVTLGAAATIVGVSRHVQLSAARFAHEMRAALAAACIVLESSEGLEPGTGLSFELRSRIALAELQRAGRLMKSLEELATRSMTGQLAHRARSLAARVRRRRLVREGRFDPHEETLALTHIWRAMARSAGRTVRLEWDGDRRAVLGRRDHYVQALSNLLGNAMRHGAGDVMVRADADSSHLRVSVTDEGAGLSAPLARLTRGRLRRRRHGHGLPVADWAVRRLGGRLRSAPAARGARLVIELPLERELLGDGVCDWYTRAREDLDELQREQRRQRGARVIPLRRPESTSGDDTSRARGSQN